MPLETSRHAGPSSACCDDSALDMLNLARYRCSFCGADLPPWFDSSERIFDVDADDVAFARWLETACASCGRTPKDSMDRGSVDSNPIAADVPESSDSE